MSWAVWITGLPGSGKSVIARAAAEKLRSQGHNVVVLELDEIRRVLTPNPTYSDAEREAVYRGLVYIGAGFVDAGTAVIFDATAHRRAWRELARATVKDFAEIQLVCPLEVCRQREAMRPRGAAPPGIYAQAAKPGARVPGVTVGYEPAQAAELTIDTATEGVAAASAAVVALVNERFSAKPRRAHPIRHIDAAAFGRLLLEDGTAEQNEISGRARAYLATRLPAVLVPWRGRSNRFASLRERMVERQIAGRGVRDAAVLAAMLTVPRERFVPDYNEHLAYEDQPLPIGQGQTISQPYIVAAMAEALGLDASDRVLEVGTGSGYAAAVLAEIAAEVYTIERLEGLAESARRRLGELGYANVHVRHGDGSRGWPEHAPYDAIIVTASGPEVPSSLLRQLAIGGRLVMPVGPECGDQRLIRIVRTSAARYERQTLDKVAFVPLIGAEGWPESGDAA